MMKREMNNTMKIYAFPELWTKACAVALASTIVTGACAVDLAVLSVELTQGEQFGTTTLVGGRPTMVRVKVRITGQTTAQPNVDAVLRMYVGGVQVSGSPIFSHNGPITAPIAPNSINVNDTLNFKIVAPVSADVDFQVVVDPLNRVIESDESNNSFAINNKVFACRKVLDVAYVSINYAPGGGQPVAATIEPGVGDAFMRGIYAMAEMNYHRSPLGPYTFSSDINSQSSALLAALQTIRLTQIPAAGYARPEFVYGWLLGNPFSGNGQAIGIPGDVAFGNSEASRFQRTFGHEIGHCWGRSHTSSTIGFIGFDVEHHLVSPLSLAQTHATTQSDVMVAGLLTNQAWVDTGTYNDCLSDTRSQCSAFAPPGGGEDPASDAQRVLQLSGAYQHEVGRIDFFPVNQIDLAAPTADDRNGDLLVQSFGAEGDLLSSLRWRSGTTRESCALCTKGKPELHESTPVSVLIPASVRGIAPARIEMREMKSGRLLATRTRTPSSPIIASLGSRIVDGAGVAHHMIDSDAQEVAPFVEIFWGASDQDDDSLSADVLYSRDGGASWSAITVNETRSSIKLSLSDIPVAPSGLGIVKLRVTDGLNVVDAEMPAALGVFVGKNADEGAVAGSADWSTFWGSNNPDIHLISSNTTGSYPDGASILLHGSGWDLEDQYLPESGFTWTSSLAGPIGTGRQIFTSALNPGTHTITLRGTDLDGSFLEKSVWVIVTERQTFTSDINGDGRVSAIDLAAILSNWGGSGGGDLNFDGVVDGTDLTALFSGWTG